MTDYIIIHSLMNTSSINHQTKLLVPSTDSLNLGTKDSSNLTKEKSSKPQTNGSQLSRTLPSSPSQPSDLSVHMTKSENSNKRELQDPEDNSLKKQKVYIPQF